MTRWAVVGAAAALAPLLSAGSASAAPLPPELVVGASSVAAGAEVAFTGRGFTVPPVESCEVVSSAAVEWGCSLDGHAYGSILLAEDAAPGTYDVLVCAPSCASPWAGSASGRLTVQSGTETPFALAALVVDGVELTPAAASAGDEVFVEAASVPTVTDDCVAEWAGEGGSDATCTLDGNGVVAGVITAPDGEGTQDRTLVVCWPTCADPVGGTATAVVTVEGASVRETSPTSAASPSAPATAGNATRSSAPVAVGAAADGFGSTVLLGLTFVVLLTLVAAVGRWTLRRPPPLPTLRVIADPQPSLSLITSPTRLPAPTVRVRRVRDDAPSITMEVSP